MYTVGQKLYFVPAYNHSPYEVTIIKVGRKLLHCSSKGQVLRLYVETLRAHIDDWSGQAYLSQSEYEKKVALGKAWDEFRRKVAQRYSAPDGVTVEKIQAATALLFREQS